VKGANARRSVKGYDQKEKGENELQGKFPSNQRKGVIRVKSRGRMELGMELRGKRV
jgi:hypothetical protein